ncbi:BatD family protein [Methanohalophilus sp.]|uniref:BatD family protein n=1 Tax=Methanohalophilus sp. TaxID=1966352 RepID=UPI00260851CE|nr:BatD family protein [Methanohalophilus sp.]MDK2892376.1 hypothetical protein [Methanohalophilus sp.]
MQAQSFSIMILIILFLIYPVNAYEIEDVQWDSVIDSKTMHWGDRVDVDEYTIETADFDDDGYVYVNLYKNGVGVKYAPMQVGDSLDYRDVDDGHDIRVYIKEIDLDIDQWKGTMQHPTAKISVYMRGLPEFDITIDTNKDTYDPRTTASVDGIEVSVKVKNTGEADAYDITLRLSGADLDLKDGDLVHEISELSIGETSETFVTKFEIPLFWEETDIDITATVEGYDINNDLHTEKESHKVTIKPKSELLITKSTVDEVYMGNNVRVKVSMRNWGLCSISGIHVEDSLPTTGFEMLDNVVLEKDLSLAPDESVVLFEYSLKPINDGKYKLPPTEATFTVDGITYTAKSQQPEIQVDGPVIEISQSLSNSKIHIGETSTVTVTIKNSGNRPANVKFSSEVPEGLSFVSGDLFVDQVLDDGKSVTYSYVVKATENGTFTIPPVQGNFIDLENYKGEMISNSLSLLVGEQVESESSSPSQSSGNSGSGNDNDPIFTLGDPAESENTHENTDDNKVEPGFSSLLGVIIIGLLYMFKQQR